MSTTGFFNLTCPCNTPARLPAGIRDVKLFRLIERENEALFGAEPNLLTRVVDRCVKIKAAVVEEDEKESGLRMILNFGHTLGHGIEAALAYSILHGEAVSIGMIMAFDLSARLGLCPPDDAARVKRHFAAVGLPMGLDAVAGQDCSSSALINHMRLDKKVRDGRITFILVRGIGNDFIADDVSLKDVEELLDSAIAA